MTEALRRACVLRLGLLTMGSCATASALVPPVARSWGRAKPEVTGSFPTDWTDWPSVFSGLIMRMTSPPGWNTRIYD